MVACLVQGQPQRSLSIKLLQPNASHCAAVNATRREFNTLVLGWFSSHDRMTQPAKGVCPAPSQVVEQ